jgi:hypothetical protein
MKTLLPPQLKFKTPQEARTAIASNPFLTQRWRDILEPVIKDWEEQRDAEARTTTQGR